MMKSYANTSHNPLVEVEGVKIKKKKTRKNESNINIQQIATNLTGGINISAIEGIGLGLILCMVAETGLELTAFPGSKLYIMAAPGT